MKKKTINKKKQTTRKNKRKSQKNKIMIGGGPKINFPYTYFIIDYNLFRKYSTTLNPYLNGQTNACNNISVGNPPLFNHGGELFLNNMNEACIIVLKYIHAFQLSKNNDLLYNFDFLNNILGHAKIIYYKGLKTIGVYNVCLHRFVIINQEGAPTAQLKETKPGYGTVLFNCIYTCILFLQFPFDIIWLAIDINNVEFKKVAWLYTSKGFKNPIFSNIAPDGTKYPFYFIQLTSDKSYVNNTTSTLNNYNETIDLYDQIKFNNTTLTKEGIFFYNFSFDKSAILTLRLMPFITFSESKDILGIGDFSGQRETAGTFLTYGSGTYQDEIHEDEFNVRYILSLNVVNDYQIKYAIGEPNNVSLDLVEGDDRIFHTHNLLTYITFKVLIAPPSAGDFSQLLQLMLRDIDKPMINLIKFCAVISIEGIWIYSFGLQGIRHMSERRFLSQDQIQQYEYPLENRFYDWSDVDQPITQEDAVKKEVDKYLDWFKIVNARFDNFFSVDFQPWNKFDKDTIFHILYYNQSARRGGRLEH